MQYFAAAQAKGVVGKGSTTLRFFIAGKIIRMPELLPRLLAGHASSKNARGAEEPRLSVTRIRCARVLDKKAAYKCFPGSSVGRAVGC